MIRLLSDRVASIPFMLIDMASSHELDIPAVKALLQRNIEVSSSQLSFIVMSTFPRSGFLPYRCPQRTAAEWRQCHPLGNPRGWRHGKQLSNWKAMDALTWSVRRSSWLEGGRSWRCRPGRSRFRR